MTVQLPKAPAWAMPPTNPGDWKLEEIKNGVDMDVHPLTKSCTVLGRAAISSPTDTNAPTVDGIPLQHESCSRFHAQIAFDRQGIPWLLDLGSTHGTKVNRKPLPSLSDEDSHGFRLYPGDVLQFGASTRLYCLEGPAQYERQVVPKVPPPLSTPTALQISLPTHGKPNETMQEGISWGMDFDENVLDQPQEASAQPSRIVPNHNNSNIAITDQIDIPEKHRRLWERIQAKTYKMGNLHTESERIRAKGEDLTSGQELQLQKNQHRITQLQTELQELEHELHEKLNPSVTTNVGSRDKKKHAHDDDDDYDDEDDDVDTFYDRTVEPTNHEHHHHHHHQQQQHAVDYDDSHTEESLTAQWKKLHAEWKPCDVAIGRAQQIVTSLLEDQIKSSSSDSKDSVESYFLQNDLDLARDTLQKAQEKKQRLEHELQETEHLLMIVNPKLVVDRDTGSLRQATSSNQMAPPPPLQKVPPKPALHIDSHHVDDDTFRMPPPSIVAPSLPSSSSSSSSSFNNGSMLPPAPVVKAPHRLPDANSMMLPPPQRKRIVGPAMPPPTSNSDEAHTAMPPPAQPKRKERNNHMIMGTLSMLSAVPATGSEIKHGVRAEHSTHGEGETKRRKQVPVFDPQKDDWTAPEGQDGSGRTKLHAKFAGRY